MLGEDMQLHRFTLEDVQRMRATEVLLDEDRVELIDGVLVDMTESTPPHSWTISWLNRLFLRALDDLEIRTQDAFVVAGGYLVPDLMVIEPHDRDEYVTTALLTLEVSATSHHRDRSKSIRYARAGVAEYWQLDIDTGVLIVERGPTPEGYAAVSRHGAGDVVTPLFGRPEVDLREAFGR
jgi:Uma2 family endonuclease